MMNMGPPPMAGAMPPGPMPGMGAPMGAPSPMGGGGPLAQGAPPATLLQTLLGPLAAVQEQERADLESQQQSMIAQLVAALSTQPSPQGMMAVSEPAPAGLGVEAPMPGGEMGVPEDDFGGAY